MYFDEQCPNRVLFVWILFINLRCYWKIADILKVFSQSLLENVEVFKAEGCTNSTHSLYSYVAVHSPCIYLILFKCGALYRLFQLRSFHNLLTNKREATPHFLFFINRHFGVGCRKKEIQKSTIIISHI